MNKFKNINKIIIWIMLILSLTILSIDSKVYANSPDDVLEIYFTLNGNKNITKEDFESAIEYDSYITLGLMMKPTGTESMPINAVGFVMNDNDLFKSISTIKLPNEKQPVPPFSEIDIWNAQASSSYSSPGLIFNIIRSIPGEFTIPTEGYELAKVMFEINPLEIPDNFEFKFTYDDFGSDSFVYKSDGSNVMLSSFTIGDPNAGPDASLSSLSIDGLSTNYLNLTSEVLETKLLHEVNVSYADGFNGNLTFTPTSKKSGAIVEISGKKISYESGDFVIIKVTDPDDASITKTYEIEIFVEDPNTDTSVTFTTNKQSSVKKTSFIENVYDITVDFNTLEIQVIPQIHTLSTVDKNPLYFSLLQPGTTQTEMITVTAEDGSTKDYTVHVTREIGNSDTSFEVAINNEPISEDDNTYSLTIAETVDRFSFKISGFETTTKVYYKLGNETSFEVTDYTIMPLSGVLSNIPINKNETVKYTILAVAQDGTPEKSYIEVSRDPSTNVSLSKVTINEILDGTTHAQELTRLNQTYTYTVKDNQSQKLIFLVSGITGEGQKIEILNKDNVVVSEVTTSSLSIGDNHFKIQVTAQDETIVSTYDLIIKKLSDEKEITQIELKNADTGETIGFGIGGENGFVYDVAANRYTFTLEYGAATNFELTLMTSNKSTIFVGQAQTPSNSRVFSDSFNSINLQNKDFSNITIKAENGTVTDAFSIRITRVAASTDNTLENLEINGARVTGFASNKSDYPIAIFDRGTDLVYLEAFLPANSKATIGFYVGGVLVSNSHGYNLYFNGNTQVNVEVRVTSESGVTFTYKLPVIAASNDSSIKNIEIYNGLTNELIFNTFHPSTLNYLNIVFPYGVSTIKVVVTTNDDEATVKGIVANGTYILNTSSALNLTIYGQSEAGVDSTNKYNFSIKRETPRNYKDLETLSVKYLDGNGIEVIDELDVSSKTTFNLRVDNFITPIQITATILGTQGERIIGSSNNTYTTIENFTTNQKTRTITVTVEDEAGQQKTYTIHITRANNDKTFETVTIGNRTYGLDEFNASYKLTLDDVLFSVDRLNVSFTMIENSNSTIVSNSSFIGNNLSGIWYLSKAGILTATFQVKSEFGELSPVYTIEVVREAALDTKALNSIYISTQDDDLLLVTGSVENAYDIRVDRDVASVLIRTTLPLADRSTVLTPYQKQTDEGSNKVYTYTLTLNNPNANAATIHQITVQAEDGSTKTYTITVWRRNANIILDEVIIKKGEDIIHTGTFETAFLHLGSFEFDISELTFIIQPSDINSRITINSGQRLIPVGGIITTNVSLVVGTNREINLKIESDIGFDELPNAYASKSYKFTYDKKQASHTAELDFLEAIVSGKDLLEGITLDFKLDNEFGDFIVNRTQSSVVLNATAKDGGKVTGIGSRILNVGQNQLLITVTSQSGAYSKDYVIIIYRNNNNHDITNIEVSDHVLDFKSDQFSYDLGTVLYDEDILDISVTLSDNLYAKYYVNNVLNPSQFTLSYGLNKIIIQAESDYGIKGSIYTIEVFRESPYVDTDLDNLHVSFDGGTTNQITFNANTYTYTIELNALSTPTTVRINPTLKNALKQIITSSVDLENDISIVYQSGEINQTIRFVVDAEDNAQQIYTIIIKKGHVKSGDNSIQDVVITSHLSSNNYIEFDVTIYQYDLEVSYSITQLNVDVLLNDANATLTFTKKPVVLVTGANIYAFYVTAENGTQGPLYTITVTRNAPSSDNNLKEILIADPLSSGTYLLGLETQNPNVVFDGRQTYTITLNENYLNEVITILFTKKLESQVVTGDVNKQLLIDQKTKRFEVNVKPEDPNGITRAYFIQIEILYEQNSLTALKIDGQSVTIVPPIISFTTLKSNVAVQTTLENSYGYAVIKDSEGQVVSPTNLKLEFGENIYTIEVYSETDVLIETHDLEIIRQKHSDKDIFSVSLVGNDSINYLTGFDMTQLTYQIEIPISVSTLTLSAIISETAKLTGGGIYTINLDQVKVITFYVVAENGDISDTYTIEVTKRSLSTENEIGEIRFRDPLDNTRFILGLSDKSPYKVFNPSIKTYTIQLGLEYVGQQITIRYEKKDPYQTVTGIVNGEAIELIKGSNVFKLTVYPEDIAQVDPQIYTVTIEVKNQLNDLESLKVNNELVAITGSQLHYETESETARILYTPKYSDGSVILKDIDGAIITNEINLDLGENTVIIEVYNAFDELVKTYELIITRHKSSDTTLGAQLLDSNNHNYLVFNPANQTYIVELPYQISEVNLSLSAHPNAITFGGGLYNLVSGQTQIIQFYVEAENGDRSLTYTIHITRKLNDETKLASLTIKTNLGTLLDLNTFDPETDYYTYQVNELHTGVVFNFTTNYGQTVTGVVLDEVVSLNHGLNIFKIYIQAEDEDIEPWIITVEIQVIHSDVNLSQLLVDGQDIFDKDKTEYILDDVSSDINALEINAILMDPSGSIYIQGVLSDILHVDLKPGENQIKVEIVSEDLSTTKTYIIKVRQLLETIDTLDLLTIQTNLGDYLLGQSLNNPAIIFNPLTQTYTFNVNESIDTIFIDYILGSSKQSIYGPVGEHLTIEHGTNRFEIIVSPEDTTKSSRTYDIEVIKMNDDIHLDSLGVNGTDIYEVGVYDYVLESVTNDTTTIEVLPNFLKGATYQIFDTNNQLVIGDDVPLQFGVNTITIKATSESGLYTQNYTIEIKQTYSNQHEIIDVRFFDASSNVNRLNFDAEITNYDIEFPATTSIARLRVETHAKAGVYINQTLELNTRKDFTLIAGQTITVTFYVVAEDGTKGQVYTVNVYQRTSTEPALSDNTNLLDVSIEIPIEQVLFDFDPAIYEYTITVPYTHNEIYIKGHPEGKGATVSNEGAYKLVAGQVITIRLRVIAEDGTVAPRAYQFNVTRQKPNTDTTLKTLVVETIDGQVLKFDQAHFNPDNRMYNITLPEAMDINSVHVKAEKNHITQTLYNIGIISLHGEIEGYYNTIITVTVVAEDGSIGEYIIYVLHDLDFASIAEVKDISIIGDDGVSYFGLEFENHTFRYDNIVVPFNVDTTRLIVQTIGNVVYLNENHVEIEDNRIQAFDGTNKITYRFRIESTNGQNKSEVYTIVVTRQTPDTNNLLESLELGGDMIRGFDPNVFEYHYIHPLQFENFMDVYGVAQSMSAHVRGNDVYTLFEGQTRTIQIEVTAQSGDKATYIIHISYVNSNALLGELVVYEMIGEEEIENKIPLREDTLEYIAIIGKSTRYVNIKGFAKDQGGASIRGFGIREVGTEDHVVEITVTSGDGYEEITYLITLRRNTALSSLKEITLLQINDKDILKSDNKDPFVYTYNLSRNAQTVKLSAVTNNQAKLSINGGDYSSHNINEIIITEITESQVISIAVQAEDGSVQNYMVVINKVQQPSLLLTILLILSIILWVITAMILIHKRIRGKNKKDKNQLIF